jgi:hypothetical protein
VVCGGLVLIRVYRNFEDGRIIKQERAVRNRIRLDFKCVVILKGRIAEPGAHSP